MKFVLCERLFIDRIKATLVLYIQSKYSNRITQFNCGEMDYNKCILCLVRNVLAEHFLQQIEYLAMTANIGLKEHGQRWEELSFSKHGSHCSGLGFLQTYIMYFHG